MARRRPGRSQVSLLLAHRSLQGTCRHRLDGYFPGGRYDKAKTAGTYQKLHKAVPGRQRWSKQHAVDWVPAVQVLACLDDKDNIKVNSDETPSRLRIISRS